MPDYIKKLNQITQGPDYIGRLNDITGTKPKKPSVKKPKPITPAFALKKLESTSPKKIKPVTSALMPISTTPSAMAAKSPTVKDAVDYAQRVTKYKGYLGGNPGSGAAGGASGVLTMQLDKKIASGEIDPNDPALADAWRQVYGTDANIFGKNFLSSASLGATDALVNLNANVKASQYGDGYAQMINNLGSVSQEENDQHKAAGVAGTIAGSLLPFSEGAGIARAGAEGLVGAAGKVVPALGKLGNVALREGTARVLGNAIAGAGVAGLQSAIAGRNAGELLTDMGTGAVLGSTLPEAATGAAKMVGKGLKKLAPKAATAAVDSVPTSPMMLKRKPINKALGAADDIAPVAAKADDAVSVSAKPADTNIGAMESKFAREQGVSKVRSNTIENTPFLTDEVKAKLPKDDYMYNIVTEKQSMLTAQQRLETDYAGEIADLITPDRKFSGEDIDTALTAATSMADNGDFQTATKLIKNVQKAGTEGGQEVQAFAKWSRNTPAGKVLDAQQAVDKAVREATETKLPGGKAGKTKLGEKVADETKQAVSDIKAGARTAADDIAKQLDDATASTTKKPVPKGMHGANDGNIPVQDWAKETGNMLSKNLESRVSAGSKQKPTTQVILNDLMKFAEEHALPKRTATATKRTAVDRVRDYFNNREFYAKAWKQAQENIRTKYADNPEMLDAFDEWANSTIGYNADPMASDKTMMDAIMKTVSDSDETIQGILTKSSLGDDAAIKSKIYEHLKQAVGADNVADAKTLEGAVSRFVNERTLSDDPTKRVGSLVKGALRDINVKLSKLVSENKASKDTVRREITDLLVNKHGISTDAAEEAATRISDQFDTLLKDGARKRLEAIVRTGKKGAVQKTMMQKVQELINLGAYDDDSLRELVMQKEGLPVLDANDAKQIYELTTQAAQQTDDYMRRVLEDKATQIVRNKLPIKLRDKVLGVRRMSMLLNPKTLLSRNALGNVVFNAADAVKDAPGTLIDKAISLKTGVRTTSLSPSDIAASAKGFKKGAAELAKDIRFGVDTSPTKHEMLPRTFKSKTMNFLDQTLNKMLQAGDRPFYEAAYSKRLNELKRLGYDLADDNILAGAKEYALDKVFQNNSVLSKKAKELKSSLGVFGDISIPFTQTPANIFDKMIDYSPAGLVKAGYFARKMATEGAEKLMWNQKKFVDSAARSLTGSGLLALGYVLANKGIITGKSSTNAKVREADKRAGKQGYSFVVDGQSYTYDWASPVGGLLAAGADMYQAGAKKGDVLNATTALAAAQGLGNSFFQQSYLDGLSDLFAYGNPSQGLMDSIGSLPSSFVPTAFKQAAQSIDPYQRDTYDADPIKSGLKKIAAKVPGLSMALEPKIGADGYPLENFQNRPTKALESTLSPGFYATNAQTPVEKELYRVYQQTGKTSVLPGLGDIGTSKEVTINGDTIKLTPEEWTQYQKDYYALLNKRVAKIIIDPLYSRLTDAKKATMLTTVQGDVGDAVLESFAKAKGIDIEAEKKEKDTTKKTRDALRNKALRVK